MITDGVSALIYFDGFVIHNMSIKIGEYDPFLLTGYEAFAAVQRLTAKGELFFEDIPHDRQLRWLNFIRKCNRLAGHIRASERPGFPYYRI